jgi:hypothetical protein
MTIKTFSSDGWADRGDVTQEYEEEAWGGISIRIHSPHVSSFDEYYWSLKPHTNLRNPWFKEFWESHFSCSLGGEPEASPTDAFDSSQSFTVNKTDSRKLCTGKLCHQRRTKSKRLMTIITQKKTEGNLAI